jgi:outer membrane immunogenic protein
MRRFAFVGAALLSITGFVGAASAADLATRPYTKAPSAFYNWTGFYIGANGGYGWGSVSSFGVPGGIPTNHAPSGALAGGQIGYNWQTGPWVYGLEADGDWANIRGSALCPNPIASCASDTRALASFRGRLGWATGPVLLYGTGGLGYANTRFSALTIVGGLPALGATGSYTTDRWGYAAGAGIEYGFTPNWSAKLEYMHYGFGTVTAPVGTLDSNPVATRLRVDTVKVGINYRWGGPIASTY